MKICCIYIRRLGSDLAVGPSLVLNSSTINRVYDENKTTRYMKKRSTSVSIRKHKSKPKSNITSHLLGWLLLKKKKITNVDEDVEFKGTLVLFIFLKETVACIY